MADREKSAYFELMSSMRASVPYEQFLDMALILNETRRILGERAYHADTDDAYDAMHEAASKLDLDLPVFREVTDYAHTFHTYMEMGGIDWEEAIKRDVFHKMYGVVTAPVAELCMSHYDASVENEKRTVLIAEAEKFTANLLQFINENSNAQYVLTTQSHKYSLALKELFRNYTNVEILEASIYTYGFLNRRFDWILSCPLMASRTLAEEEYFICKETDLVALENLSLHLNDGGRLVMILPARVTFGAGRIRDLRSFIQDNYRIFEISALPAGAIAETGVRTVLLELENSRPDENDDIQVYRYAFEDSKRKKDWPEKLIEEDHTFAMLEELKMMDGWSVERIFAQQTEDYQNFQNSSLLKEQLGNVAEIFRGKAINSKDPSGRIGVVNITNIRQYDIDYDSLEHIDLEERKITNFILQEGDVLLPARGTAIRTAVFHEQQYPCIASSNIIVIRPDPRRLNSVYLKIFLDSPIGNGLISGAQQGTVIMNISYKDLAVLDIPLPNIEKQREAAEEYIKGLQQYKDAVSIAEQRWQDTLTKLQNYD